MRNNPLMGLGHLLTGLGLVLRPGLRRYVAAPVGVGALVFGLLAWAGWHLLDRLIDRLLPTEPWLAPLSWLLWPLFALTAVLLLLYGFTVVANLIAAPFNGLLAERVEALLTGRPPQDPGGLRQLLAELLPSLWSELTKLRWLLLRAVPLLVLFLVPGVNLVAPFLWLAFNAWYLALQYLDYPMGNHGIRFAGLRRRVRPVRLTALGFGAGLTLLMAIPGINLLAMPAGVAGATALWVRELAGGEPVDGR
jgi:CysZ protein